MIRDGRLEVERAVIGGRLVEGGLRIEIEGGRIAALEPGAGSGAIDATLLPAPIDLQVNGAGGRSVEEATPEALDVVARTVRAGGAAAFLPTLITAPFERLLEQVGALADWIEALEDEGDDASSRGDGARALPLGIHVEGPFLEVPGAHPAEHLVDPTPARIDALLAAARGHLRLVTLAPARAGAPEAVARLCAAGVRVSIGHAAEATHLAACVAAGATAATHLYNAMGRLHHREPGLADRVMDEPALACGLIPDGVHVHPILLRAAFRRLGPRRLWLTTDCMAAAGMPPGRYELGGQEVVCENGEVRNADGTLAGSAILMRDAMTRFRAAVPDLSWPALAEVTSGTAARLIGADARGRIALGARAEGLLVRAGSGLELV